MKKIITLTACLATFSINCNDVSTAPAMKKIVISTETMQANGQILKTEQTIRAIVITPEQASELKTNYETFPVDALKNSMPYHKVFMIEDTAYFIMAEDADTVKRSVMVTDDVADQATTETQEVVTEEQTPAND